jgi:hypothetical protein
MAPELVVSEIPIAAVRVTPEQTEFTYPSLRAICGGASITHFRNMEMMQRTPRRVLLIPRPARRLVIGYLDTRCPAPLP